MITNAPVPSTSFTQATAPPAQTPVTSRDAGKESGTDYRRHGFSSSTHRRDQEDERWVEHEPLRQPAADDAGMQVLMRALGHISISDAGFASRPFDQPAHCGELADKWLEQFTMYCRFKKLSEDDQIQLFKLLVRDQARDSG